MKHRWWHRFFMRGIAPSSQEFANLEGWRLAVGSAMVHCRRCSQYFVWTPDSLTRHMEKVCADD